jgi:hypothetical protein
MADTFGTPEISQEQALQPSGNSKTVIILLILIVIGGAVLGYLLYRQSNEPAPVLEEVIQTNEFPVNPAAGISEPAPDTGTPTTNNSAGGTLPENTPGTVTDTPNPAQ